MDRAHVNSQRGGVLLVVAVSLIIVCLMAFAIYAMKQSQRKLDVEAGAQSRLDRIERALEVFVATNRRLPCPANGTLAPGVTGRGRESINLATGLCVPANQSNGVVPWIDLGLSEDDSIDPWQFRISYRVQPSLASNLMSLMNMSWCDVAGDATSTATGASMACSAACSGNTCTRPINYLYGKGLPVQDASNAWLNEPSPAWNGAAATLPTASGAAYVLISHGPNGLGAYSPAGVLNAGATGIEAGNNNAALTGATVFRDTPRSSTFDDIVRRPTIAAVLAKANLGARTPH